MKVYPRGVSLGVAPRRNPMRKPPKRTECKGWSAGATLRNQAFLMSVKADYLPPLCYAVTLTFRDCPASHEEFQRIREAMFDRLRRLGMDRMHWVVEWTKRGLPHIHACIYPDGSALIGAVTRGTTYRAEIIRHWLELTEHLGTRARAQHVVEVDRLNGWFEYMAKHASRGQKHYQRSAEGMPEAWHKTGRMWGYTGHWPRMDTKLEVDGKAFFMLRRMSRSWLKAQARAALEKHKKSARNFQRLRFMNKTLTAQTGWGYVDIGGSLRTKDVDRFHRNTLSRINALKYARTCLRTPDPARSIVRGLSQWIPDKVSLRMLDQAIALGGTATA